LLPAAHVITAKHRCSTRHIALAYPGFPSGRGLPLLGELALAPDDNVAAEAVRGLALLCSREELEAFLNRYDQGLCARALGALDAPEWLKPQDREQER
jgi:hypothetical protein